MGTLSHNIQYIISEKLSKYKHKKRKNLPFDRFFRFQTAAGGRERKRSHLSDAGALPPKKAAPIRAVSGTARTTPMELEIAEISSTEK